MIHKENRGGDLRLQNYAGYTGLYQFGASALASVGYIKQSRIDAATTGVKNGSDHAAHKAFLNNPDNWNLPGGLEAFKRSKALQDKAMVSLTNQNLKTGWRYHKGEKGAALGYAAASHIGGAKKANNWFGRGIDSVDGNRTRTSEYARWGSEAAKSG